MLPAGKYYLGDLCYVMHDRWDEFCDITISEHACLDGEFKFKDGVLFASYGTKFGDGSYNVSGTSVYLGVDAGLIGCIRVEDIASEELKNLSLGYVVDFDKPFQTWSENGVIHIGHLSIDTDADYEDEDDYDE